MKPEIKQKLNWSEGDYILTAFWNGGLIRVLIGNPSQINFREEKLSLEGLPTHFLEILVFSSMAHDKMVWNLERDTL